MTIPGAVDHTPNQHGADPVEMPGHGQAHPRRRTNRSRRRLVIGLLVAFGLAGAAAGAAVLRGSPPPKVVAGDPKASGLVEGHGNGTQSVKVVRPRRDPHFRLAVQQLAVVEPYAQAGLRARVSGVVRYVAKDIGEPVHAGELLVEIDVPDLQQAVAQKDAVVRQRLREVQGAEAEVDGARAAVVIAAANIRQKEADVGQADSLRVLKQKRYDRVRVLVGGGSVTPDVVDEAELDARAAASAVESARAAVEKAKAEQSGKEASLKMAGADLEIKRALVEVARGDRDVAAAHLGYARLYAPFDGVIVARTTDPGRFVANATSGASEPLVTVARTDFVTVSAKLPDNAAPFVSWETEAVVEFAQLPGVVVRGPLTRFSSAIDPRDRTMQVEVDVFNGPPGAYRAMMARAAARATVFALRPLNRMAGITAAGAGLILSMADYKGWHEGYALTADWGAGGWHRPIVPGTIATMRVNLDQFTDAYLLPAAAVYSKGGQSYVLLVEDGTTRAVPVAVQVNDGRLVKVALLDSAGGRATRELTGNETVVMTRQVEVGEGTRVETVFENW